MALAQWESKSQNVHEWATHQCIVNTMTCAPMGLAVVQMSLIKEQVVLAEAVVRRGIDGVADRGIEPSGSCPNPSPPQNRL